MKPLTPYQKRVVKLVISSATATLALLLAILAASSFVGGGYMHGCILFMSASFSCAAYFVIMYHLLSPKRKFDRLKCYSFAFFYLVMTVTMGLALINQTMATVTCFVWFASLVYSGLLEFIYRRKARYIVYGIMKTAVAVMLTIVYIALISTGTPDLIPLEVGFVSMFVAIVAFASAMISVFAGVRSQTLAKIIRKTYAVEIIYGLLVLIVASSLMLMVLEENMTFPDALWYCFAIVTTIGFGDFTAVSLPGRLISVALGIYGIVVVALITSIIVNFYNEVSNKHPKGEEPEDYEQEPTPVNEETEKGEDNLAKDSLPQAEENEAK